MSMTTHKASKSYYHLILIQKKKNLHKKILIFYYNNANCHKNFTKKKLGYMGGFFVKGG